jgi:carbonic anhydrase/acetyltransferase-like protein (isoleucine patch superfamily)
VVHGTTIEDRVLIGMAAVLLNGVHIESDCVIAAGTLLTEGTRIPARSLVMGRPGKVKRQLTDEEVAEIRWYSDNYVNYRLDYSREPGTGSREPEKHSPEPGAGSREPEEHSPKQQSPEPERHS